MLYAVKVHETYGWDPDLLVEVESTKVADPPSRVIRVVVDRVPVGFVVCRPNSTGTALGYDYWMGQQAPTEAQQASALYASESRFDAINVLVQTHLANVERKFS